MSSAMPINLRARSDLVCQPAAGQSAPGWVLKDPWSLEFFQLGEEEFFLFQLLRKPCTRETMLESFDKTFAPKRLRPQRLQAFLVQLHRAGLLIAAAAGQGEVLCERDQRRRSQERWRRFSNPLAIRFAGINPTRWFDWLYPRVAWCFSIPFQVLCVLLLLAGGVNAWFLRRPLLVEAARIDYWLEFKQMWLFLLAIGAVKVLHEFGHALTLRHWGGRCHELGIMLLAFTPCLYCNVSDAWLLDSKWRRIAVSFAGIWVELLVAAAAVWLWSWTDTGLLHDLAFVLSVVCSVNVLLINGNPLMRFDGYFVLSDWVERPNLSQQAGEACARVLRRAWFPVSGVLTEGDRQPLWLAAYACVSFVYRVVVIALVVWGIHQFLVPYRLEVLAWVALLMIVGQQGLSKAEWLCTSAEAVALDGPGQLWRGRGNRLLALTGVLALLGMWSFPDYVVVSGVIMPTDHHEIRVAKAGRLIESLDYGTFVRKGEAIARLVNPVVSGELQKLRGVVREQQQRVETLREQKLQGVRVDELAKAEQALLARQAEVEMKMAEQNDVVIRARYDGYLIRPQTRPAEDGMQAGRWRGDPLDEWNAGCFLGFGDVICSVSRLEKFEALLLVDASDLGAVTRGAMVEIRTGRQPRRVWRGDVIDIAPLAWEDEHPSAFHLTKDVALRAGRGNAFMVRVRIAGDGAEQIVIGGTKVCLRLTDRSIWQRSLRWARRIWNAV